MNINSINYKILSNENLPNKFLKILPRNVKLIRYTNGLENILYLSDMGIIDKKNLNESIGFINFYLPDKMDDKTDDMKESIITFLKVNLIKKGMGIGTYLLLVYAWILNNEHGNIDVSLDDMSDYARGNSIYTKIGCVYDDDVRGPEMTCKPIDIINTYDYFYNKYKNKGFFISIDLRRSTSRSRSRSRSRLRSWPMARSRSRLGLGKGIKNKKRTYKNK